MARSYWDDLWLRSGLGFGGWLIGCEAAGITTIISKVLPVANPDTGWKPMLHYTVAWWLWARETPVRKHFSEIARHSGEQCSIGF